MISEERRRSPFYISFRQSLHNGKKLTVLLIFLQLLGLPLLALCAGYDWYSWEYKRVYDKLPSNTDFFLGWAEVLIVFSLCAATVCALIFIVQNFSYLFKREETDTYLSLPITRKQQFWSHAIAGLTQYIVPYLIGAFISAIIMAIFFFMTAALPGHSVSELWDTLLAHESEVSFIIWGFFSCLLLCVMFYAMCLAVTMFCGRVFEAAAYPLIFHVMLPLLLYIGGYWATSNMYGVSYETAYNNPLMQITNPVGGLIYLADNAYGSPVTTLLIWTLVVAGMTALYFFAAYKLFTRRKAEDVGRPFVFKILLYIIEGVFIFIVIASQEVVDGDVFGSSTPAFIIMALIGYVILEVVSNRKQRNYLQSAIRFLGTVLGSYLFLLVSYETGFFGMENYVPPVNAISSVTINTDASMGNAYWDVTLESEESVRLVTELHEKALKEYRYHNSPYADRFRREEAYSSLLKRINISYKFKWGLMQNRTYYNIPSNDLITYELVTSDEFVDMLFSDKRMISGDTVFISDKIHMLEYKYFSDTKQLLEAYRNDMKKMTYEEFCFPETIWYIDFSVSSLCVPKSFTETLALLDKELSRPNYKYGEIYNTTNIRDIYSITAKAEVQPYGSTCYDVICDDAYYELILHCEPFYNDLRAGEGKIYFYGWLRIPEEYFHMIYDLTKAY